ncbi:MAG: choice-of-anchor D domain-containing protein [Actinomycetia bacterium]|nr:choice-of-anchor D domain-containing protein [Actinomycetes bacterium]
MTHTVLAKRRLGRRTLGLAIVLALFAGALALLPSTQARAASGWSDPVDVSASGPSKKDPQITTSADGRMLTAVWSSNNGDDFIAQSASSTDAGLTWSTPVNLSAPGASAYTEQIVGSADGRNLTAVWFRGGGFGGVVQTTTSSDGGATWSTPSDVSDPAGAGLVPQIAGSPQHGRLTVVWMDLNFDTFSLQILTSSSTDGGLTWSNPQNLSGGGPDDDAYEPAITSSADGTQLTAVWDEFDGSNFIVRAASSSDAGANWAEPVELSSSGRNAEDQQMASSSDGRFVTAAWEQRNDDGDKIIQTSTSKDSGMSWSPPADLSAPGQSAGQVDVTASSDGGRFAVAWTRDDGTKDVVQVARSTDGGSSWGTPENLSDPAEDSNNPALAGASDGKTLRAVWAQDNGDDAVVRSAISSDSGASWSSPERVSNPDGTTENPQVTMADNGSGVAAIWQRSAGSDWVVRSAVMVEPRFAVAPDSAGFGEVLVGEASATQAFTVTNQGTAALTVSDVSLTGANSGQFTLQQQTCTQSAVAVGSTCNATVSFDPNSQGAKTAAVSFTNNATGTPQTVALTGTGTIAPPPDKPKTELAVSARNKTKKLKPLKATKIVKSTITNGTIRKATAKCFLKGEKLTGKDKRANCNVVVKESRKATTTNVKMKATPECSVGLRIQAKVQAKATGEKRNTWKRTWKVKNNPRTSCTLTGNG